MVVLPGTARLGVFVAAALMLKRERASDSARV
jgi:hypothetical protein